MDPRILHPKMPPAAGTPGVYVGLDDLIRMRHKATGFSFLPRQPLSSLLAGRHASRMRGRGLSFEELRLYYPGDDIRSIDWKVTARTQKPHARVFTEERDRPGLLVVDQRIAMFFGTKRAMKSVVAAELAALGAWRVAAQGDRVGGLVFDDQDVAEVRPTGGRVGVMRLLHAIVEKNQALGADADLDADPSRLNDVLERISRLAKHDALVTVISDFDGVDDDTERLVKRIAAHNDVVLVVVHDRSAQELPSGRMVVSDGALQVELDTQGARTRKRLEKLVAGRLGRVLGWQAQFGIPALPILTDRDPVEQVRRLLGRGPSRRRR